MNTGTELTSQLGEVVERFDHVSIAVRSFDGAASLLALMGAVPFDGGISESGRFEWQQFRLPGQGTLELIAPLDVDDTGHFINQFIAERGEGLHHLTFKVRNLNDAVAEAQRLGFTVVGFDDSDPEWKEAFVHPKSANGVLVQLAEFHADH